MVKEFIAVQWGSMVMRFNCDKPPVRADIMPHNVEMSIHVCTEAPFKERFIDHPTRGYIMTLSKMGLR